MQPTLPAVATALAPHLPVIDPLAAKWSKVFHDLRLSSMLEASTVGITWRPANAPEGEAVSTLALSSGGDNLDIEVARMPHPAVAMATAPGTKLPVRRLAALALFGAAAHRLEPLGVGAWRPTLLSPRDESASAPRAGASPWITLRSGAADLATVRIARGAAALLRLLSERLRSVRGDTAHRAHWTLPARVVLHRQAYSADLLSSLGVGDALLLPLPLHPDEDQPWRVSVEWGTATGARLVARGRVEGDAINMEETPHMNQEDTLTDAPPEETLEADTLAGIDIPVRFELETIAVPLAELEAVSPGYVIELATPISEATVRIVACGQLIAHAELVAVGDHLGVRIVRMVGR